MSVPSEEQELVLTVREDPQDQAYALLTVLDRNQPQARLEDVSIRIDDETGSRTVNLRTPAPDGRGRRYRMPFGKPGEVLWCQASARGAPDPRYSVRTPVFRPDLSPEWLGLAPAPEVLAEALAEGVPARFAVAGDHARLLDELLRVPELPPCQVPPPRSHVLELALALLVAASLGAEWFVERRRLTGSD
jgi:hypothetical protein